MCWCGQLCHNLIPLQDKRGKLRIQEKKIALFDTCICAGCFRKSSKCRNYSRKGCFCMFWFFFFFFQKKSKKEKISCLDLTVLFNGLAWAKKINNKKNSQERHPKNMLQLFCIKNWAKIPWVLHNWSKGAIQSIWWRLLPIKQV